MLSVMIGSTAFKLLSHKYAVESLMRPVLFVSALALLVPVAFPGNQLLIYSAFLVFEFCVGIFWPAMCTMRGKYVPEETRSTVMNFFRWADWLYEFWGMMNGFVYVNLPLVWILS